MPYEFEWKYSSRVIHQRIFGHVTIEEFAEIATKLNQLVDEGQPPVHLICDSTDIAKFPTNLNAIRKQLPEIGNSKIGWVVLVTRNPVINQIAYIICQVVIRNVRFRTFDKVDTAFKFLTDIDPTLRAADTRTLPATSPLDV